MRYKNMSVLFLILLAMIALVACNPFEDDEEDGGNNDNNEPVYSTISEGTLNGGDEIPVPGNEDDIVLTVTGKVGNTNQGETIVMDIPTIESLGVVEYTVDDPFLEEEVTYQGVLMSDLLELWEVPEDATNLHFVALNDYAVDVPIDAVRDTPVFFALKMDGEYMPVSTRGPSMLVFPYNDFEFEEETFNSYWIWQIKDVEVQ